MLTAQEIKKYNIQEIHIFTPYGGDSSKENLILNTVKAQTLSYLLENVIVIVHDGITGEIVRFVNGSGLVIPGKGNENLLSEALALGIVGKLIDDLTERQGLDNEWRDIDSTTKDEIIQTWKEIVLGFLIKNEDHS